MASLSSTARMVCGVADIIPLLGCYCLVVSGKQRQSGLAKCLRKTRQRTLAGVHNCFWDDINGGAQACLFCLVEILGGVNHYWNRSGGRIGAKLFEHFEST